MNRLSRIALATVFLLSPFLQLSADPVYSQAYIACFKKVEKAAAIPQDCVEAEFKLQDERLNRVYGEFLKVLPKDRIQDLQKTQLLWIKFRDANCGFYFDPYGGSMHRLLAGQCRLRMTADRADELLEIRKFTIRASDVIDPNYRNQ